MAALICGSLAYDSIMVFEDHFKNHILPEKVHMISVSFLVPQMRRDFGGCAGNIAYNLKLLGGEPVPMAAVGKDFGAYRDHLDALGIPRDHVLEREDHFTAQAFITTDLDDNQITAFHPGAMSVSHLNKVKEANDITIGIVAPDGRDAMMQHAADFNGASIPFFFDPGQAMPLFDGQDLRRFIDQATWVTVNDYEMELVKERIGWSEAEIAEQVEALIITRGAEGSDIMTGGETIKIESAPVSNIANPTGCGDAYRAGLLYGLEKGYDWQTTGRIASLMGAIKVETESPQGHQFTMEEFGERFEKSFGAKLPA
ncbi:MAG: carbohydrate kinase family protein [Pseudomonadota bacterium]